MRRSSILRLTVMRDRMESRSRSNIEYIRIINIKEGKDAALVAEAERKKRI